MEISFLNDSVVQYRGDALILGKFKSSPLDPVAEEVNAALDGLISRLIESGEISGKQAEITLLHTFGKLPVERVAIVGLGDLNHDYLFSLRRAAGAAAGMLRDRGCRNVASALHLQLPPGVRPDQSARASIEGAYIGLYRGEECKSEPDLPNEFTSFSLLGVSTDKTDPVVIAGQAGRIAGEATNFARRLVNLPPNEATPSRLAQEAEEIATRFKMDIEVLDLKQIEQLGMGAFAAVARGSDEPARLIILRHRRKENGPQIAFIGKGLTFDSGGLSIKPSDKLELMKQDMAGAAAVLGAMRAIGELELDLNITAYLPATENVISGHAYRPGDVVKAINGKTIEIISTDAEGRLLLADVLAYAQQQGATHLLDVATLTGACIIALGHVACGVMGNDSALVEAVLDAGDRAGERMWRLPLFPEYRAQLDSHIADLKNVGGRPAGAITAGWFLREFVSETAWVHIDIAGPAWSEKSQPHQIEGGTGVCTRTLITLAERLAGGGS